MESDSEEVEIKIEYNESLEKDPLCEYFDANVNDAFTENQTLSVNKRENEVQLSLEETHSSFSNEEISSDHQFLEDPSRQHSDVVLHNQTSWYKEIDNTGRYLCRFCDLKYSTVQTLSHHVKKKHPNNAKDIKNSITNNKRSSKLKCHICKVKFKTLSNLEEHVKGNHDIRNVKNSCYHCNATFLTPKLMLEHLYNEHKSMQNRFYSCITCGYRTTKKSHYNQHKNTHLSDKSLQCMYCSYRTNYLPNFKIHVRIHTNEKPYKCDFNGCEYCCAAKSALRSHQLKHNRKENMLYCDKCSYNTVYKQSLKKHLDSHIRNSIRIKL